MTAYVVPPYYEHYDNVDGSDLGTKYSQGLTHIEECVPYAGMYPVPHNPSDEDDNNQYHFTFVHKYRWLHFCASSGDAGIILADTSRNYGVLTSDTTRATLTTSLSGDMEDSTTDALAVSVFDLDTVEGLQYGQMYHIWDCWSCFELPTPAVTSAAAGSWNAMSNFPMADNTVITAADLNGLSNNCTYLYNLSDRPNEPFLMHDDNGDWAKYYTFRKTAQRDYIWYWFDVYGGSTTKVEIRISSDGGASYGSDYLSAIDTQEASTFTWTGYLNVSALTDDQTYILKFEVDGDSGGADVNLYMLYESVTNS